LETAGGVVAAGGGEVTVGAVVVVVVVGGGGGGGGGVTPPSTAAVCGDKAVVAPAGLDAVTATRRVAPASAAVGEYSSAAAPATFTHAGLHRCH